MKNRFNKLVFSIISRKIQPFISLQKEIIPDNGWIENIRKALGLSMKKFGEKMGKSAQAVSEMQKREREGTITLNSLKTVAEAINMKIVYAIIPIDSDSLEQYIENLAAKKAKEIVMRTNNTMMLENQEVSEDRLSESMLDLTNEFIDNPTKLWD